MKRKPVTLLLGCLCLALLTGAYVMLKNSNEKAEQEEAEQNGPETILTIRPGDVTQVSFQIDGSNVTFGRENENDEWKLAEDQDFPVDPASLTNTLEALAPLGAVRTLTDTAALSEYGLDEPQNTIAVTTQDGTETTITLGDTNASTGDDYIMLNGDDSTLYTISSDLRSSLSDNLYDYADGEELPTLLASDITGVDVSLDSQTLSLSLKDNLWTVSDGAAELADVDQSAVSGSLSDLTGLSYTEFLDYNCTTPEQYGLNPPTATITISWKEEDSEDSDETDLSDTESEPDNTETELSGNENETAEEVSSEAENETEGTDLSEPDGTDTELSGNENETAEEIFSEAEAETDTENNSGNGTIQQLILHIGTTDDNGNYYVQREGSAELHTIAPDVIEKILSWTAGDFEAEPESESETKAETESESGK